MENVFMLATKGKVRFAMNGMIGVEDLWDLSLTKLDTLYKKYSEEFEQSSKGKGLLDVATQGDSDLKLKLEIIKEVFTIKKAESEEKEKKLANQREKARIRELIAQKKENSLGEKSVEELEELLKNL